MTSSGITQRSAPADSAAARARSTAIDVPGRGRRQPCSTARRRCAESAPDQIYRGTPGRLSSPPGAADGQDGPSGQADQVVRVASSSAGRDGRTGLVRAARDTRAVQSQREYVLRTVEERGIRFVQLWFTDVLGTPKGFNITSAELENALDEGMTFDGSAIDGFSRVQEADVLAVPDPTTFQILPWHHDDAQVARVFCDIANLDGSPFEGDPRHALRRTLERAHAAGYTFFASPEVEYFYFAERRSGARAGHARLGLVLRPDGGRPHDRPAPALGAHARGDGDPRRAHPARGRPQPARDRPALHRRPHHGRHGDDHAHGDQRDGAPGGRVRELHAQAARRPNQGSGMHTHFSLWEGERNAFVDDSDRYGLSDIARRSSPDSSSTPARSPRSPTSGSTPTSASSAAPRRRSPSVGPATTDRRWCGSRS